MQTHLSWRRAAAAGATGWLLLNLLAACGGAAQPVSDKNGATKPASTTPPTEVAQATQAPITATVAGTAQVTSTQPATCSAVEIPNDAQTPPANAQDWSRGPENAPLTVIEYGDFQ